MADGNPLGPQPDFNLIGDELKKASNLSAITNGQQILAELQAIRQDIADSRRDLITIASGPASTYLDRDRVLLLLFEGWVWQVLNGGGEDLIAL